MKELFVRDKRNPVITTRDVPYQANAVFNAGAADLGDEVLLLVRVESTSGRSHLIVARSADGVTDWRFEERALIHPAQDCPYETNGVEDCRLTWMEDMDCWGIAYTAYTDHGPGVALATTKDFRTIERVGLVIPPNDKNATLFPRKFDGLYAMLHRPCVSGGSVWISYSPDLIYWGRASVVVPVRGGPWWDAVRVGAGLAPIETEAGWLVIYHGVKEIVGGPIYRIGAALLDLKEPHRLIARARRWLLSPQEGYERTGDAPNVVFSCGGIVREGKLWMYYGAADSCICLATAKLSDILAVVKNEAIE
ncbi:MAG: glycosidase [Planctomycetes bacterium SM23_65]|nr:MAG: glycosidase [Planctomycetes bacterium SM23_65]